MNRILFYDDAKGFGGHTITAIDAVKNILRNGDLAIDFVFFEGNNRLKNQLMNLKEENSNLRLHQLPYKNGKLSTISALFSPSKVKFVRQIFDSVRPDLIVLIQGSIESSTLGLLAAKSGNYYAISFIPLTHSIAEMRGKLAWIRDLINRYYYKLPNQFIVISQSAKDRLLKYNIKKNKISLVYCGADIETFTVFDRKEIRSKYFLSDDEYVIGVVARIQFVHKAHDFLIQALASDANHLKNIKVLIVGDGPDETKLKTMVQSYKLEHLVKFVPWKENVSEIYSALDMLIIPSRFEGLPLVMLEAMYYNIPIVATNVDGMSEILPKEWLFEFGDRNALVETLLRVKATDNNDLLIKNRERILREFNVEEFGAKFYQAISGSLK